MSYIGATGAKAMAFRSLQPAERGWLQCMKNMGMCVQEAAVTGDYGEAFTSIYMKSTNSSWRKCKESIR